MGNKLRAREHAAGVGTRPTKVLESDKASARLETNLSDGPTSRCRTCVDLCRVTCGLWRGGHVDAGTPPHGDERASHRPSDHSDSV